MPEAGQALTFETAQMLCASVDLVERGRVFDVLLRGQPARAFVLRFEGRLVGYVNRCGHLPVEMEWQPGEFLDQDKRWIVCAIHGASYEPADGRCVAGPCRSGKLIALAVAEFGGHACWYPCGDIRPVSLATASESPS